MNSQYSWVWEVVIAIWTRGEGPISITRGLNLRYMTPISFDMHPALLRPQFQLTVLL